MVFRLSLKVTLDFLMTITLAVGSRQPVLRTVCLVVEGEVLEVPVAEAEAEEEEEEEDEEEEEAESGNHTCLGVTYLVLGRRDF